MLGYHLFDGMDVKFPMHVIHLCNLPLSPDHPDFGRVPMHPGRWVLNLAVAQKKFMEISPELIVHVPGATKNHFAVVEGIPVHYIAAPNRLRSLTLFYFDRLRLARVVRNLNTDLVHAHGTEDAYLLAAQATRLPYVVTAQGLYSQINSVMRPPFFSRNTIIEWLEAHGLMKATDIIAKSQYVADWLHLKYPHLRIHRIPNTFDSRLLDIPIDRPRQAGHLAFVGTISERKGVHLIRQALEITSKTSPDFFSKIHLHVFGDRSGAPVDSYEGREKARLKKILGERLILHGTIPGLEVAQQLSRIPILLAPSLEEMFGNQLIEALIVCTHVIVTDKSALAENVRRYGNGTIISSHADELSQAIHQAQSNLEVGLQTRNAILKDLSPSRIALLHNQLYQMILKRSNA